MLRSHRVYKAPLLVLQLRPSAQPRPPFHRQCDRTPALTCRSACSKCVVCHSSVCGQITLAVEPRKKRFGLIMS